MQIREYPFYLKATVILFGVILFVYCLDAMQDVLVPLAFAGIFAILLNRLVNKFQQWKIPRVIAIVLAILIAFLILAAIMYFLSSQVARFGDQLPELKAKLVSLLANFEHWVENNYGVTMKKQGQMLDQVMEKGKPYLGQTVSTALGTLALIFIIPVYIFLFLFYKTLILNFLFEIFSEENSDRVAEILRETKSSIQSYMVGLLLEALVVGIMNSTALFLLGVKYAILLGVIGALLNMLPYIGGLVAIALPVLVATLTSDGFGTQLGIIGAYTAIQFIDNNILVPRIVSSKVQINALISIVIVLLGGALWGIAGMFLSIPFIAILKIIFDRIDGLKPWGKLLGDRVPTRHKGQLWNRKQKKNFPVEKSLG